MGERNHAVHMRAGRKSFGRGAPITLSYVTSFVPGMVGSSVG